MQRTGRFIISTAIVFAVMTQTIFADILRLKDGTEIKGTFVRYNYIFGEVVFRTSKGQILTLSISPNVTIIEELTTDSGDPIIDIEKKYGIRNIALLSIFGIAITGSMLFVGTGSKREGSKEQGPPKPED